MDRPPIDKTLLPTPNTRTQFYIPADDGNKSNVINEPQIIYKSNNIGKDSANEATERNGTVKNEDRDDGDSGRSNRNYFGSMVSINEYFNNDADVHAPKLTECENG